MNWLKILRVNLGFWMYECPLSFTIIALCLFFLAFFDSLFLIGTSTEIFGIKKYYLIIIFTFIIFFCIFLFLTARRNEKNNYKIAIFKAIEYQKLIYREDKELNSTVFPKISVLIEETERTRKPEKLNDLIQRIQKLKRLKNEKKEKEEMLKIIPSEIKRIQGEIIDLAIGL